MVAPAGHRPQVSLALPRPPGALGPVLGRPAGGEQVWEEVWGGCGGEGAAPTQV